MQLSRVQITNYRSINDLTLYFNSPCRILVGVNEAGKTNILEALALLHEDRTPSPDDVRNPSPKEDVPDEAWIRFIFKFSRQERIELYETAAERIISGSPDEPIVREGANLSSLPQACDAIREGLFRVNVSKQEKGGSYWAFPKSQRLAKGWKAPSPACPAGYTFTDENGDQHTLKNLVLVHESQAAEIPSEYLAEALIDKVHNLLGACVVEHVVDNLPECIYWHYSDEFLIPARIQAATFAADPDSCVPLANAFGLAGIEDITAAMASAQRRRHGMRNLLDRVGKRATAHIRRIWPEYRGIALDLRENGDFIDTGIRDVHNTYDLAKRSDGFKRFISFLLMLSAPTKTDQLESALILIDDPDAGLHPSGERHLRDELIRISEKNQVVYATHSIFMVDRSEISRHAIVKKTKEVTTLTTARESNVVEEEVLYNALGFSAFEVLSDRNIIFEGWRDKHLFDRALARVPGSFASLKKAFDNIGRCHVYGVKDVRRVVPMLQLANRHCLIISDSDEPARQYQREHATQQMHGEWRRYDQLDDAYAAVTVEDYLKREFIVSAIQFVARKVGISADPIAHRVPDGPGVLKACQAALRKHPEADDEIRKAFEEQLKTRVFSVLKPTHIRDEYYGFLGKMSTHLANS